MADDIDIELELAAARARARQRQQSQEPRTLFTITPETRAMTDATLPVGAPAAIEAELARSQRQDAVSVPLAATEGLLANFGGEVLGAAETQLKSQHMGGPLNPSWWDEYRQRRDSWERVMNEATQRKPQAYLAGALLQPNPAGKLGLLGRMLGYGAQGAVSGVGASRGDLTRGEAGQVGKDAAMGGLYGAAAGGVAEAAGAGMRKLGGYLGNEASSAVAERTAQDAAAVDKEVASLEGKWRSEKQKGSRLLENTQRGVAGAGAAPGAIGAPVDPQLQAKAMLALSSPEAQALNQSVLENSIADLPGQLATINAAENAYRTAAAAAPQGAANRTAAYFAQSPLEPLKTFARSQVPRQLTGAAIGGGLYAAGEALDNDPLKAAGGAAYATIAGAPGFYRALQNLGSSPLGRKAMGEAGAYAADLGVRGIRQAAGAAGATKTRQSQEREKDALAIQAFLTGG